MVVARALAVTAAALLCSQTAQADDNDLKTAAELRALSEDRAARQARRDLSSLLADFSGYGPFSTITIGDVWFFTEPRASDTIGLCEKDVVQLYYETIDRDLRDPRHARARPNKIAARTMYAFLRDPASIDDDDFMMESEDGPSESDRRRCRSQTEDGWTGWITADSALEVLQGYQALQAARDAVAQGLVTCDEWSEDREESCQTMLNRAADPSRITRVYREGGGNEPHSFRIDSASTWVTIKMNRPLLKPEAGIVESVKVEEYIIIT